MEDNFASIEYFATLSKKEFVDEIEVENKTKIKVKTRAPSMRDLQELRQMAPREETYKFMVLLVQKCMVQPQATQLDIEQWNSGYVTQIARKILDHATFGTEKEGFLKSSLEAPKEEVLPK